MLKTTLDVLFLRLQVKALKKAIAVSDRLPAKAWTALSLVFLLLLSLSVVGLILSQSPKAFAPARFVAIDLSGSVPATPNIRSINPYGPVAVNGNQNVFVNGSNFQSGLTVTVYMPSGGNSTLSGSQIQNVSSGSFTMTVTAGASPSSFAIQVYNPDSDKQSNEKPVIAAIGSPSQPSDNGASSRILFWVSLFGTIANTVATISTITLAWIANKRYQTELLLKMKELELKEAEVRFRLKELALKIIQMQQEIDRAKPHPLIVLA